MIFSLLLCFLVFSSFLQFLPCLTSILPCIFCLSMNNVIEYVTCYNSSTWTFWQQKEREIHIQSSNAYWYSLCLYTGNILGTTKMLGTLIWQVRSRTTTNNIQDFSGKTELDCLELNQWKRVIPKFQGPYLKINGPSVW